jgi:hypothetical protein
VGDLLKKAKYKPLCDTEGYYLIKCERAEFKGLRHDSAEIFHVWFWGDVRSETIGDFIKDFNKELLK